MSTFPSTLTRTLTSGVNLLTLSDYHLTIVTSGGAVQIYLQSVQTLLDYRQNRAGYFLELEGMRFIDYSGMAATNNITFYAADGDTINGAATYTVNQNGISGLIFPVGGNQWQMVNNSVPAAGGVTSVGLAAPNIFTVSNSPVTTTGTLTFALVAQNQNLILASPDGSTGTPTFRNIVGADFGSQAINLVLASPSSGSPGNPSFRNIVGADFGSQLQNLFLASPNGSSGNPLFRAIAIADLPAVNTVQTVTSGSTYSATVTNAVLGSSFIVVAAGTWIFDLVYEYSTDASQESLTVQIRVNQNTALTGVDISDTIIQSRTTNISAVNFNQTLTTAQVALAQSFIVKSSYVTGANTVTVGKMFLRAIKMIS